MNTAPRARQMVRCGDLSTRRSPGNTPGVPLVGVSLDRAVRPDTNHTYPSVHSIAPAILVDRRMDGGLCRARWWDINGVQEETVPRVGNSIPYGCETMTAWTFAWKAEHR